MSRSYLYLILAMVSWGIANPFSDLAVEYLPVSQMFVLEIASGVLVLSLFFRKSWVRLPWKWVLVLGLLQPGLSYLFGNIGYSTGTVSTGLIVMSAEVLLLAAFGWWFLSEKLRGLEIAALAIGVAGVLFAGYSAQNAGIGNLGSNLAFAASATAAASYSVLVRKLARGIEDFDAVGVAWGQAVVSLAVAAVAFPITASFDTLEVNWNLIGVAAAFGSGIFGVALPFVWFAKAAIEVPTGHAAIGLNLIPIVGIALGALIGRGLPTTLQLVGGSMVLFSIFLLQRQPKKN
jgi:drug/metabolite transporter (DMT)-like permease